MINPRGSTGFGTVFTDAVKGDWGGAPYRDIMNGVQYILTKYPQIDYERMCACGGSYGGFVRPSYDPPNTSPKTYDFFDYFGFGGVDGELD
jgi:hypothetical protein